MTLLQTRLEAAQNALSAAQTELASIRSQIDSEALKTSALWPLPQPGDQVFFLRDSLRFSGDSISLSLTSIRADEKPDSGMFVNPTKGALVAKALNTLLTLRAQRGTEPATDTPQFVINAYGEIDTFLAKYNKLAQLSPCFKTREDALRAVNTVPHIIEMFHTLHTK